MPDGELSQQRINGPDLDSFPAARGLEFCCGYVILEIGHDQGQAGEMLNEALAVFRPPKPLEKFLNDYASREEHVLTFETSGKGSCFRDVSGNIATKREGPNACVHQHVHFRERSFL
jgi:hypothetical protein